MSISPTQAQAAVTSAAGMSADDTRAILDLLMGGHLSHTEGGALLAAWSARGETGAEVAAVVNGLLERATRLPISTNCLDLCGTGGSGRERYNVSTTAAFLLAGAGVRVAKHGNRGSVRANGSFDLLDALGVPFAFAPPTHARLLDETGLCFLFARLMHPAVAAVAPYRAAAGRRTIFNLAGPLANPCRPRRQLIGVASWGTALVLADALALLGVDRAVVVHGEPGIDEVSISGATRWIEVGRGTRREGVWRHPRLTLDFASLPAGDAVANARIFPQVLAGTAHPGLQGLLTANVAAALDLWHDRPVLGDDAGLEEAEALLGRGVGADAFSRHRAAARQAEAAMRASGG